MENIPAEIQGYSDQHALRHPIRPGERESWSHLLISPEHGLAGFFYPTVRAEGLAKTRVTLLGPALEELVAEEVEESVPQDMDIDNWQMKNVQVSVREPHKSIDLNFSGERIKFDGRYEAMYPVYGYSTYPPGSPPYFGDDRTEQHGRLTANIEVDGRKFDVDSFMIHDHSWGPRVWGCLQHHKWVHAITAESSIHYTEFFSYGGRTVQGYLMKDGIMRQIVDVQYNITFDDEMLHTAFQTTVVDTDGRTANVDSQAFTSLRFDIDPEIYLNEVPVRLELDGVAGVGWVEFGWTRRYVDYAKQFVHNFS